MFQKALTLVALLAVPAALAAQSEEFGVWKTLFNGKDLSGWKNCSSPSDPNRWLVEDGALTNEKDGVNNICTAEEYGDCELELEYKIPKGGNSGIYLRGRVEVQVFDSSGKESPGMSDAGAIYGVSVPLKNMAKPAGEWNHHRILHIGHRLTVWMNGALIQDNVYGEGPTVASVFGDASLRGPLMLQGDHTKVWYRNIRIRPLFGEGWKKLWNGVDLSQLTTRSDRKVEDLWKVEDRAFTNIKWGGNGGHDLWTKEPFGNFLLHYAYRSDPKIEGGNSGFYLRDQWEIQILRGGSLTDPHTDGALYSKFPTAVVATNGPGQWNQMDVKVQGVKIWVWQNGKLVHDGRICDTRTDNHGAKTPAFSKAPFKFQGDHGKVWFTDLYIKPLPDGE